jgi:hypothetical protein
MYFKIGILIHLLLFINKMGQRDLIAILVSMIF